MKQAINFNDFISAFHAFKRYDQFGYDALKILFNFIEQAEEETGEEMDLDVIDLCCNYSADTVEDVADNYDIDMSECETDADKLEAVLAYLNDNTQVCGVTDTGSIVYCNAF